MHLNYIGLVYWFFFGVVSVNLAYAVWRGPILQFSTLYFALPLLLIFVFSSGEVLSRFKWTLCWTLILVSGLGSLVFERQHFELITRSDRTTLNELAGSVSFSSSFLLQPEHYHQYFHGESTQPLNTIKSSFLEVSETMFSASSDTIGYGYNLYENFERIPWLYDHYGSPIVKEDLFNAQWLAFDRNNRANNQQVHLQTIDVTNEIRPEDSLAAYGPVVSIPYDRLTNHPYNFISLRIKTAAPNSPDSSWYLTLKCVRDGVEKAVVIQRVSDFLPGNEEGWAYVTFAPFTVPGDKKGSTVEFYLWNPQQEPIKLEKAEVLVTEGNRYMYGLLRPIPRH